MKRVDAIVIGAGPAGLSAAIECAKRGLKTTVFDENSRPGGQLFKQIHKFFGSKEHKAKIRGFKIGEELLKEASAAGVEVVLNAVVSGIFEGKEALIRLPDRMIHRKADIIIAACGANENMVPFENWTLPGVMGAGAAQTMMNLHAVRPGRRVLMLGSGNVGLVVGFQLLQAGCEVLAVVDALPKIGGYGVHAAKLARTGVPFYLSHTIIRAEGKNCVEGVVIGALKDGKIVPGSEKRFDADTVCLAVGLSPQSSLCEMAGCLMEENPAKAGLVPIVNEFGETSVPGIFAAGDVSGIEEASSAMIQGRIAGIAAAERLGFISKDTLKTEAARLEASLSKLRAGMFAPQNRGKNLEKTEEGCPVSMNLLTRGSLDAEEIYLYPGARWPLLEREGKKAPKIYPVIECTQNIPCDPCGSCCPAGCILVDEAKITALPAIDEAKECAGCGLCVASCSGQAIFLLEKTGAACQITLPLEFLPLPVEGAKGAGLGRRGQRLCDAEVVAVKTGKAFDKTNLLTIKVPAQFAMDVRFFKEEK